MQIKQRLCFLMALFVLVSNSGLAFNVHYCGEKIAAITSVFAIEEVCDAPQNADNCCVKEAIKHKKCCSDKEITIKDTSAKIFFKFLDFNFDLFIQNFDFNSKIFSLQNIVFQHKSVGYQCLANAPPFYKLYCQFTLFG